MALPPLESGSEAHPTETLEPGEPTIKEHGCAHYRRRCKIRAPCCNKIFYCRHCHDEATSSLSTPKEERHEIVRHDIKQVICAICDTEQEVAQVCSKCGIKMGEYFCDICKFYDDETEKDQFHCDECGICRVGGRENFFHCQKCGSCYSAALRDNHSCVENSMKCSCPVCYEYLFDSVKVTIIMTCGHTMHQGCYSVMARKHQYRCPICSKTVISMSREWRLLDREIEAVPMPEEYKFERTEEWKISKLQDKNSCMVFIQVSILCNDCNTKSEARFHILGHKCSACNSYNTRRISTPRDE